MRTALDSSLALQHIPRMGWLSAPSPITELPRFARQLGVESFAIKRDDLLRSLRGGTKTEKARLPPAVSDPFADADTWHSAGAIGSGHLVALTEAARILGRRVKAHCFWEEVSGNVLDNLAFTASGPTDIEFYQSRLHALFWKPQLVISKTIGGIPVIPPGGTIAAGMAGLVQGAFELVGQIRRGEVLEPERIYVALGSGGTAVGLSVGLALAGLSTRVHAVAVVERVVCNPIYLGRLTKSLLRWLEANGVEGAETCRPAPIFINPRQIGPGYGRTTMQSLAACDLMSPTGIELEPIYTGKAMAGLLADAEQGTLADTKSVLFWNTAHRGPLPHDEDWRGNLPGNLASRLEA